jgi:hypothetical protein
MIQSKFKEDASLDLLNYWKQLKDFYKSHHLSSTDTFALRQMYRIDAALVPIGKALRHEQAEEAFARLNVLLNEYHLPAI